MAATFSPPTLSMSLSRDTYLTRPSSDSSPRSPVRNHPSASMDAAVASGLL